jgi:hypothetical protein
MPFEHSCFVSYRHHAQSELHVRFIDELCAALRNELSVMIEKDIFIDRERLTGGTFFNAALAGALCKSACMIVVYTPTYFSHQNPYCAREYRAMELLEQRRLALLQGASRREMGLIIPIILRGAASLPHEIGAERHYFTFEQFTLASQRISRSKSFESSIREIAAAIHARWLALGPFADQLTCDCAAFNLPSDADIAPWLSTITQAPSPFPIRTAGT